MFFRSAFPPTVKDATSALIINWTLKEISKLSVIFKEIIALIAPLKTPAISPITSAQIFATFAEFLISLILVFAPLSFFDAFAWKSDSFPTVTATAIRSNKIPN